MAQLGEAFDFTLVKTDHIAARPGYVLSAKPHHEYRPPNDQAKALTGMQGTLWMTGDQEASRRQGSVYLPPRNR